MHSWSCDQHLTSLDIKSSSTTMQHLSVLVAPLRDYELMHIQASPCSVTQQT